MSEHIHHMAQNPDSQEATEPVNSTARIDEFLRSEAQVLGKLMGIPGMNIRVGRDITDPRTGETKNEGWTTNLETGEVTIDPSFFLEQGYDADSATYACLHEVSAHLREVLTEPRLTQEILRFTKPRASEGVQAAQRAEARFIFHNVLSDIAGNNRTHAMLPRMQQVGERLYHERQFKEDDYTNIPRHLQFLYKMIRQEMIPGSDTAVSPEVDQMLTEFRDYLGTGRDLLKYSVQVAKSPTEIMPGQEKFAVWTQNIYPRWLELLELDEQDPRFQKQQQNGQQGSKQQGQPSQEQGQSDQQGQPTSPTNGTPDFSDHYQDYREEHHPEPMTKEEHEAIEQAAKEAASEARRKERQERQRKKQEANPAYHRDVQLRQETGHGLAELQRYNAEVERWHDAIDEMCDLFRSLLSEHIGVRRRLRGGHTEGAILTPERLAQTIVDIRTGVSEPKAFSDYEKRISQRELSGKSDYVFVFDCSGSMAGEKAKAAASTAVISMEGLARMQRDIEEVQESLGIEVDVDIRTAIYTFNKDVNNPKPLSHGLDTKQRLDTYADVLSPGGGNADSHALQIICDLPPEPGRNRTLIFVADGEADNPELARVKIDQLRHAGWNVYGISIGSEAAVQLFAPHSRRVDDPALLVEVMKQLIEETL